MYKEINSKDNHIQNTPNVIIRSQKLLNNYSRKSLGIINNVSQHSVAMLQYNLAVMYKQGRLVKQNLPNASILYQKAALKGHTLAQHKLGTMYYKGRGVQQDFTQAINWFQSAAKQGNHQAQRILGHMYGKGHGVKQDYNKAFYWYSMSQN